MPPSLGRPLEVRPICPHSPKTAHDLLATPWLLTGLFPLPSGLRPDSHPTWQNTLLTIYPYPRSSKAFQSSGTTFFLCMVEWHTPKSIFPCQQNGGCLWVIAVWPRDKWLNFSALITSAQCCRSFHKYCWYLSMAAKCSSLSTAIVDGDKMAAAFVSLQRGPGTHDLSSFHKMRSGELQKINMMGVWGGGWSTVGFWLGGGERQKATAGPWGVCKDKLPQAYCHHNFEIGSSVAWGRELVVILSNNFHFKSI